MSVANDAKPFFKAACNSTTVNACEGNKCQAVECETDHDHNYYVPQCSSTISCSSDADCCRARCGTAAKVTTVKPTSNLCSIGTPSAVSGDGPWTWTCTYTYTSRLFFGSNTCSDACTTKWPTINMRVNIRGCGQLYTKLHNEDESKWKLRCSSSTNPLICGRPNSSVVCGIGQWEDRYYDFKAVPSSEYHFSTWGNIFESFGATNPIWNEKMVRSKYAGKIIRTNFVKGVAPSVDLKANNSDGPLNVAWNDPVGLRWIVSNTTLPTTCTALGDWSGNKSVTNGSQSLSSLTPSTPYNFILTCTNIAGTGSDSVAVNVGCKPDCSCAANTCIGKTCLNGCSGTCPGQKEPSCACAKDTCIGKTCSDGCDGNCPGQKVCTSGWQEVNP